MFALRTFVVPLADVAGFGWSMLQSQAVGVLSRTRGKAARGDDATRIALVALSRLAEWRRLLVIVKPDTLIEWDRKGGRLFWRWNSRVIGRPRIPARLQRLIVEMARANRTWERSGSPQNSS